MWSRLQYGCAAASGGSLWYAGTTMSEPYTARAGDPPPPYTQLATGSADDAWDSNWDYRACEQTPPPLPPPPLPLPLPPVRTDPARCTHPPPPGEPPRDGRKRRRGVARNLLLVRHGQYGKDGSLTPLGRTQASATGARLAQLLQGKRMLALHSSDMVRARETADLIAAELPAGTPRTEPDSLIAEGCPLFPEPEHPAWRPSPAEAFAQGARLEAGFRKHVHRDVDGGDKHALLPEEGGEKGGEAEEQAENGETYEVLACHGNVIRYFCMRALQLNPRAWLRTNHANGGITHVRISVNGAVSLHGFGDVGHLPVEDISFG